MREIDGMIKLIKEQILEKGDMKDGVTSIDLDQIHGNYRTNQPIIGSIGGLFLQAVHVVQAFFEAYALPAEGEEAEKQKEKLRAFLTLDGITNFLHYFLKESKFDSVTFQVSQKMVHFLQGHKLSLTEVYKLTEEHVGEFKKIFRAFEGDVVMRDISENIAAHGVNKEVLDLVLDGFVEILLRKNPASGQLNQQKVDQLSHKVKLLALSEDIFEEDVLELVHHEAHEG